jgi:sulfatase modifying factor 1
MMVPQNRANDRMGRFECSRTLLVIVGLTLATHACASQSAGDQRQACHLGIQWIGVEGGTFTMGSGSSFRQVTVESFMMSATEITFDQYDAFCDATGKPRPDDNGWGRGNMPVMHVSYDDAVEFTQWLTEQTGTAVRLPNEAEWEYAAQGGRHSRGYTYSGSDQEDEVSWNEANSGHRPHPVGTKMPNELGLFDMSGNLWEWCADWTGGDPNGTQIESPNAGGERDRAVRGNSFGNPGDRLGFRATVRLERDARHANIGFRVAKSD